MIGAFLDAAIHALRSHTQEVGEGAVLTSAPTSNATIKVPLTKQGGERSACWRGTWSFLHDIKALCCNCSHTMQEHESVTTHTVHVSSENLTVRKFQFNFFKETKNTYITSRGEIATGIIYLLVTAYCEFITFLK